MSDLIILVPGKNMEAAIEGILSRHKSLRIRQLVHRILAHPGRDSGCLWQRQDLLRPFHRLYEALAQKVSFQRCQDAAFLRLRETLVEWFPA